MKPQERIEELRRQLDRHNRLYYVDNAPEISDREFDMLMHELEQLEGEHPEMYDPLSPTQRVGSDLSDKFTQVKHVRPMMSLANTYSIDEVDAWFKRVQDALLGQEFKVVGEMKFDGTSISLHYKGGRLQRAVTRGDGEKGDDVTANVKTIRSIPLVLEGTGWPDEFEIRGEILLPWKEFDRLNAERAFNEEPLFANPRNAAAGTLKTLDPKIVAARGLDARFYYLLSDHLPYDNHYDNMLAARSWGFKVSTAMELMDTLQQVDHYIAYWDEERRKLPVATDGLVFKINNLRQQLNLGYTSKSPRWAVAYKFPAERAVTKLHFVSFEVGRMGIITPVANLEPVLLSGTMVKRASLHNEDIMNQLDICQDDYLYVEKGGEIIPKITGVDISKRAPDARRVVFIKDCPECGTPLVRVPGEAAWQCPNKYGCPAQQIGRIEHFVGRHMMDIDGIGKEMAAMLFNRGVVKNVADLYDMTAEQIGALPGCGEKKPEQIMRGVEESKTVPFERVIYALSIPFVGETVSRRIARSVGNIDNLMSMSIEELQQIDDVGPNIAESIYNFFRTPVNVEIIERLRRAGVQMQIDRSMMENRTDLLAGKTIVISGTFTHHSREAYKEMIELNGGKASGSVSSKTSYILAGENMGPAKLEKAKKLGIPIINEDEFLEMIGRKRP